MKREAEPLKSNRSAVGYGNPPEHTRFRKGQSGNPKGRPKGTLNLATVLERTLREKVVINGKTVTKLEAALGQLIDQATSGQVSALQLLSKLVRSAEEREVQAPVPNSTLDEVDQEVVLGIMKRLEDSSKKKPLRKDQNEPTA